MRTLEQRVEYIMRAYSQVYAKVEAFEPLLAEAYNAAMTPPQVAQTAALLTIAVLIDDLEETVDATAKG